MIYNVPRANTPFVYLNPMALGTKTTDYCPRYINGVPRTLYIIIVSL